MESSCDPTARARQQLRQVFQFLEQWHIHQVEVPRQWRDHVWTLPLTDLPDHPFVEVGNAQGESTTPYVLRVRRPDETPCPQPPEELDGWLQHGWREPDSSAAVLEARNEVIDGDTVTRRFVDDPGLSTAFDRWNRDRELWRTAEVPVRKVTALFQRLFELRGRLDRDAERLQFVVGQGMLRLDDPGGTVEHPLLHHRVELVFQPKIPQFEIVLGEDPPELNTALLRNIQGAEGKHLGVFRERVREGEIHPLDRSRMSEFLTEMAHALFVNGRFGERNGVDPGTATINLWPVLMLMPRSTRYTEAIRATIERIGTQAELPPALVGIVGLEASDCGPTDEDDSSPQTRSSRAAPAPVGGDTAGELLLTKPANEAQERILRQLNAKQTVVVQGPPGTGKTHTIGNVIGHLLAHGKTVLVASHTAKALRVLREAIAAPLRPLCVSVLDNDTESRQQLEDSINGITRRFTQEDPDQLEREAERLAAERSRVIKQLAEAEQRLEQAIADEYRSISVAGRAHEPAAAARTLRELAATSDWIPGELESSAPMPLTAEEIRELYRLGQEVGADEEEEIDGDLPALRGLPAPGELRQTIARESELRRRDLSVPEEAWLSQPSEDREELKSAWNLLRTALAEVLEMRKHPHLLECMDAGRRGGPPRELWDDFVRFISGLREEIERDEALARRRTVVLACEPIDDRLLANIRALRSALSHEKTAFRLLARMGKSIHPSWRAIISASQVDGRLPASDDDFEAVEAFVRVRVNRSRLVHRWRQHLEPYPQLAQIALGDRPEVASHQHLDQLTHALSWHERHWVSAVAALRSSGIALEAAVRRAAPRTDRFGELHRLIDAANGSVRDWLQRRLQHLELNEIAARSQDWSGRLRQIAPERDTSGLARSMLDAIESRDASMYAAAHERVTMLERKRLSVERRRQLLGILGRSAPSWAAAVAQRTPPHDQPVPPGDPEKAWLFRQLVQELDRRGSVDIASAQKRVSDLRRALHDVTGTYVDRRTWSRQHRRTGKKEQQALYGWLQTVQTKGYQSGVRSMQLKAQARRLLDQARSAVPVWIMTVAKAVDSLDFAKAQFDVVILDESSQCDMLGMLLLGIAKEVIVVGDDKQVSPSSVGEVLNYTQKLIDEYLRELPQRELFTGRFSLYDMATQSFGNVQRLTEHFRCAEEIISFSNFLSYGGTIVPLRDTSAVPRLPHCVSHRVADGRREGDVNETEAIEIASLVASALEQPEYQGCSFGVISMLKDRQALEIEALLRRRLPETVFESARILCGSPPQFQGDERDVVFLSLVDSGGRPLPLRRDSDLEKRYNVAASRARDQLWVVHSLDPETDLKESDLRLRLLRHAADPGATARQRSRIEAEADSEFERQVGHHLTAAGYRIRPQWRVGSLTIDMVAEGATGKRVAIECDGDRYHPAEKLKEDLGRQMVLERLGWRFVRLRGSEYFRDPERSIRRLCTALSALGIEPVGAAPVEADQRGRGSELVERVIRRAHELRKEWEREEDDVSDAESPEIVRSVGACGLTYPADEGPDDAKLVITCLRQSGRALARREILDRTALKPQAWTAVMAGVLRSGEVQCVEGRGGAKYLLAVPGADSEASRSQDV